MFYSARKDPFLRFGDVVKGYVSVPIMIKKPISRLTDMQTLGSITLEVPEFSVVVTPCCSIEDHMLCVTPLIKIRHDFFKNSHFVEDFTIINREIEPEYCYPPEVWETLNPEEKEIAKGKSKPYTLLNLFIYEKHDILPIYNLRGNDTNYYMIDFRNVHTIKCDMIKRASSMGQEEAEITESKCIQLSEETREELRNKMAFYYGRVPEEDLPQNAALGNTSS